MDCYTYEYGIMEIPANKLVWRINTAKGRIDLIDVRDVQENELVFFHYPTAHSKIQEWFGLPMWTAARPQGSPV